MSEIVNKIPPFQPFDIVKVKGQKGFAIVTEVNLNQWQIQDKAQWGFSIRPIAKHGTEEYINKCSWYTAEELELVNNLFEMIARFTIHPFSSNGFKLELELERRKC